MQEESVDYFNFYQTFYSLLLRSLFAAEAVMARVCYSSASLRQHLTTILQESYVVMLEEFLSGEEVAIGVMPPSPGDARSSYSALPIVVRFNHEHDIAQYNGVVAMT